MSIIEPVAYLGLYALSMQGLIPSIVYGGRIVTYVTFITIGITVTNAYTSGIHGGFQIFIENLEGTSELLLVSPLKRYELVFGRLLSALTKTLLMSLSALLTGILIGAELTFSSESFFLCLLTLSLCSLSFGSIGVTLCSKIKNGRTYNIIMNTIGLPILFSSSAFYPRTVLPHPLQLLASINPLSYTADSLRDILIIGSNFPDPKNFFPLTIFSMISIS